MSSLTTKIAISDLNLANVPGTISSLVSFKYIFPTGLFVSDNILLERSLLFNPFYYVSTEVE